MATDRDNMRDNLTGLYTRKAFEDRLTESLSSAQEKGTCLSIIFLDIDKFKGVNDTHGHGIGDRVIERVATVIAESVQDPTIAARYGGEEFVLFIPELEREQAFLLGERIRAAMDITQKFSDSGLEIDIKITLSGGISAYPTDGQTMRDIIRKADQALYRAKLTGRNKICIAEEERMAAKTSHFTLTQLARLSHLAGEEGLGEAVLLREALDDLLNKYNVSEIES